MDYIFINTDFFLETDIDYAALNLSNTKLVVPKLVVKELEKANTEKSKQILKYFERYKELPYFIFDDENESSNILEYIQQYQCAWVGKCLATFSLSLMAKFWMFYGCREFRNNEIIVSSVSAKFISQIQKSSEEGNIVAQNIFGDCYCLGFGVPRDISQAIHWYNEAVEQGLVKAQYKLGELYRIGQGVPQDYHQAVEWYTKAAEQGLVKAQFKLGFCYANGLGVQQDYHQASEWYTKAVDQGLVRAQFNLGVYYYNFLGVSQYYYQWLTKSAEQGNVSAQVILGVRYYNGQGVPKDYHQAVEWLTKSAEQGDAGAQFNLGVCYEGGQGVPQDYHQAVEWFTKAAEQGYAGAQCNLGGCYYNGQGVPQDYHKAVEWYTKAAEQGLAEAQYNLGLCYFYGQVLPKDYPQAVQLLTKAAEQGDAESQYNLGVCYKIGHGVEVDLIEAAYWFNNAFKNGLVKARTALENLYSNMPIYDSYSRNLVKKYEQLSNEGDIKSMIKLGDSYYYGYGVDIDNNTAFKWYNQAANLGDIEAKCKVANCYFKGEGTEENEIEAFKIYKEIADKDSYVMTFLGECYLKGKHNIKQDIDQAIQYLSAASQKNNPDAIKLLADYYYEQKQYKEAIPLLESYKNINPDSYVDVYYKLGKCYQYLGDYKNAIANLEKLQTDSALYAIGDCYYALAQQYEQEHPDDKNIWKDLYRQAHDYYFEFCKNGNDISAELQNKIIFCFNKYK